MTLAPENMRAALFLILNATTCTTGSLSASVSVLLIATKIKCFLGTLTQFFLK